MAWICLVDDDPDLCDALTDILRSVGYGVQSFVDGRSALEAIEAAIETPRLVILDLLLPDPGGREVLRRIRLGRRAPEVPILVVTGVDANEGDFSPFTVSGVLRKPVAVEILLAKVASVLAAAP